MTADQLETHYLSVAISATAPRQTAKQAPEAKPPPAKPATTNPLAAKLVAAPAPPAPPPPAPAASSPNDYLATLPLPLAGNDYWQTRDIQNRLGLALGFRPRVLFLGDSITALLASGTGQPLWDTFYAPLPAADFAVGGITTSQVIWQIESGQVAQAAPEVVVLMIGTNNLGLGQSPEATAAGITKIVEEIRGQLPNTRILLLGVLPRGESRADPFRKPIARVNNLIADLDGDRVSYLDIGGWFLAPDGSIPAAFMSDFLHPTLWGYEVYTSQVWGPMLGLLARE